MEVVAEETPPTVRKLVCVPLCKPLVVMNVPAP
jgi:hypothetical protein